MRKSGVHRNGLQRAIDFITFPIRAVTLIETDRFGLSALASERFDYVACEVVGYCLDVGCGRHNRFVTEYLGGNGKGIDVYAYEGLGEENLVEDITHFPFPDSFFDTVTFIANLNHIPRSSRDIELSEAFRCLRPGGKIIATMGVPVAEILVHRLVYCYDKFLGTNLDLDTERGMHDEEEYFLTESEITERFLMAGFKDITKKRFWTQWGLNYLLTGWKKQIL